ncbi:aromatic-ring hydroxylase C-terminal domain-containing protein [Nocardia thraciensis]
MMFYRYRSAAVVDGDQLERSTADSDALSVLTDVALPGYRLPHLWLDPERRCSTIDLAGPGWLLLTGREAAGWEAVAAAVATAYGIDLRVRALPDPHGSTGETESENRTAAGLAATGAVLVRPDGFVAWHASDVGSSNGEGLGDAVGAILGRDRSAPGGLGR